MNAHASLRVVLFLPAKFLYCTEGVRLWIMTKALYHANLQTAISCCFFLLDHLAKRDRGTSENLQLHLRSSLSKVLAFIGLLYNTTFCFNLVISALFLDLASSRLL